MILQEFFYNGAQIPHFKEGWHELLSTVKKVRRGEALTPPSRNDASTRGRSRNFERGGGQNF